MSGPLDIVLSVLGILFIIVLAVGTGVAVAAEFSLTALERSTIDANVRELGDRRSRTVQTAHRSLAFQLSGAQVAITLTTLVTGFVAQPLLGSLIEPGLSATGLAPSLAASVAVVIALVLATTLSMVFGEMAPKNLAIARPLPTARAVSGYHSRFSRMFRWLINLLNGSANWIVRKLGAEPQEELRSARSPQELGSIVRSSAEHGTLPTPTAELLDRSLRFGRRTAEELMTSRVQIESLATTSTVDELINLSRRTGFSRFPVYGEDLDDIQGAVHVKQALTTPRERRAGATIRSFMRPIPTVPESLSGDALLNRLRDSRFQLAIVVDEYGGTGGMVTLEDVVEEIVGDVRDEHDELEPAVSEHLGQDSWRVSGQLRADEVREITGFRMPEGDYDTIAGLLLEQLGRIPAPGDSADVEDWRLTVDRMDRHRIAELTVRKLGPDSTTDPSTTDPSKTDPSKTDPEQQ